jgi:CDP-diacylglycerol--glycerol-3-phosphate 3-phosphatidyltransferase
MASVYDLKPRFQAVLRPACRRLAAAGVTANQVTLAAVALSVGAGAWIAVEPTSPWPLLALPAVLLVRMALNAIDGMLAREYGMASPLGAILNELGDVVSDVFLYLPLGFHPSVPWWSVIAVVILGMLVEFAGVVAIQIGATRRYDGPFGKIDRAAAFGLLGLLLGIGVPTGSWIDWYLIVAIGLSVLTVLNRARNALRATGDPQ